jgi:putative ABC transport system permease protein
MPPPLPRLVILSLFLRPVVRRPWRFIITVLGVAAGVASVLSTIASSRAAVASLRDGVEEIAGRARLEISQPGGLSLELLSRLRPVARDAVIAPVVEEFAMMPRLRDTVRVLGIDPFVDMSIRNIQIDFGRGADEATLEMGFRGEGVFVPERLASELNLTVGQPFPLLARSRPLKLIILGLLRGGGVASAWNRTVVADYESVAEWFGKSGRVDRVDLLPRGQASVESLQKTVMPLLPAGVRVERPRDRAQQTEGMVRALEFNLTALSGISLLVGAVLVATTLATSVVQRRQFLALLRSLGATRTQIVASILLEALTIGLLGGILGVAGGVLGAESAMSRARATFSAVLQGIPATPVTLPPWAVALGLATGIVMSLLAAALPLVEALRTPPLQGLRRERPALMTRGQSARWIAGTILLLVISWGFAQMPPIGGLPYAALLSILALFAVTCSIASPALDAVSRLTSQWHISRFLIVRAAVATLSAGRVRAAWAAGAVGIAAALAISITTMVGSFRTTVADYVQQTIRSDVWIRPTVARTGVHAGRLDPEIVNIAMSELGPGIVDPFHETVAYLGGEPVALCAGVYGVIQKAAGLPFRDGRNPRDVFAQSIREGSIMINEPMANRFHLKEGDLLKLQIPGGTFERRIGGVFYDYSRSQGMVVIDRSDFLKIYPDDGPREIAFFLDPGSDATAVRRRLVELLGGKFQVDILLNREIRRDAMETFDRTFAITRALESVSRIVALIAVVTVLGALVEERMGDFALMRAVGASKFQIARSVVWQGLILGSISILSAVACGVLGGLVLVKVLNVQCFGWTMQFVPPWGEIATIAVSIALTCGAAALLPAWFACRKVPRDLLREDW